MTELRSVAFHEAGHAVVGIAAGAPNRLLIASIVPDSASGTLGHVRRSQFTDRQRSIIEAGSHRGEVRPRVEPLIEELYAGGIAERRFKRRLRSWAGAVSDMVAVEYLAPLCVGSERQQRPYLEWLWTATEDLVDLNWTSIERVAEALLERRTLRGEALRALFNAAMPTAFPDSAASLKRFGTNGLKVHREGYSARVRPMDC